MAQVALALVLLVGAGLLLAQLSCGSSPIDRATTPANVIAARVRNPDTAFRPDLTPEAIAGLQAAGRRFQESLVEEMARLEDLSGVEAVGVSSGLPLVSSGGGLTTFRMAGAPPPTDPRDIPQASINVVSPGYFDVVRLRLRSGRTFTRLDGAEAPRVLVVNETFARELGDEPAVGRRVLLAGSGQEESWEVVGVVADVRYGGLTITESSAEAYVPLPQQERVMALGGLFTGSMVSVRTAGDPLAVIPFLREAVTAASRGRLRRRC